MPTPSKIIKFPVDATFVTIESAMSAAEAHRLALVAAGDAWAVPQAVIQQFENDAAGLLIAKFTPSLADPAGASRINFVGDYWYGVPPAVQALLL